jgi:septal ring factor EnvC (AmiA/AmiB activator)
MARFVFFPKALFETIVIGVWVLLFCLGLLVAGSAATDLEQRVREERAERRTVKEKISEAQEEVTKLEAHELSVIQELENLNHELYKSRTDLKRITSEIKEIEDLMASLKTEERSLMQEIKTLE